MWHRLKESFWITASFDDEDSSYDWVMYWLSRHPQWTKARTVDISTRSFGIISPVVSVNDEDDSSTRKICYLPSFAETYTIWYKGHYMKVTRQQNQSGMYRMKETLQLMILSRSHQILNDLLLDAKNTYHAAQEHLISIHVSDSSNNWRHVASRPKRPLTSIVLDPGIKDLLLDDARDFLESKSWYQERGIPFRRGYLLYGAPGSGKTSMIHSLAGELGLDVYVVSLSRMGLDDTSLSELISELPEKCIALMEDIDAAFHHGLTRDMSSDASDNKNEPKTAEEIAEAEREKERQKANVPGTTSRITLSGLLNALDGVGAQEGRLLFATTNRYRALDAALCRPGRMDLHVEFKLASKYQAEELFKCFYLPSEPSEDEKTSSSETEKSKGAEVDSGYASGRTTPSSSSDDNTQALIPSSSSSHIYSGSDHRLRGPTLTRQKIDSLASRFADAIPERQCSMASLQGYLMAYKTRPYDAVGDANAWVEKERADRTKKIRSSTASGSPDVDTKMQEKT